MNCLVKVDQKPKHKSLALAKLILIFTSTKIKTMATRSLIGIKLDNNIIKTIYCHWDGYPAYNGELLINKYTSPAAVLGLMELGDLSSLAETPAGCTAFHRDRNEPYDMVEARDIDQNELVTAASDYGVDYVYVYNDECEWECSRLDYAGTLVPIEILAAVA